MAVGGHRLEIRERQIGLIQVKGVSKRFGNLLVLDHVSFTVRDDEFICICGPTGCGKTTLLKIIAGLIPTTAGGVMIDGQPLDPLRNNISFVFQEPSCLPWRTVFGNIRFSLETRSAALGNTMSKAEMDERVERILDLVSLQDFAHYYPHQISAGMKQRVAIARAFATEPELLLMDEPFGYLDVQTRYYLRKEVLRIWEKLRRTVVFVTHSIEEAVYLPERTMVLTELPARISAIIPVDLPRPREYADPQFITLRKKITDLIKWW